MKYRKLNDEVIYVDEDIPVIDRAGLEFLKEEALKNPRKRMRLCLHRDEKERIHEMFIVHMRDTYVRPHKHLGKPESFFVIDGEADVILFNKDGLITKKIHVSSPGSEEIFYYRINEPVFHTLLIHSEMLCFKEVTAGPFRKEDTVFAAWAPEEADAAGVRRFVADLKEKIS